MQLRDAIRKRIQTIIEKRGASNETHHDLLDMLMAAAYEDGSKMTTTQLIDETLVLFVAGHETTVNALSFMLYLLSKHPDAVQQVLSEGKSVAATKHLKDFISNLPFTQAVIEESLHLYPPAWILDRMSLADCEIKQWHIRKGTIIGISVYGMHHHPKYWDKPDQFDPMRFFNQKKTQTPTAYMPFGAGPRLCVGNHFAMYEMILMLQHLLRQFEINIPQEHLDLLPNVTLKPSKLFATFSERS